MTWLLIGIAIYLVIGIFLLIYSFVNSDGMLIFAIPLLPVLFVLFYPYFIVRWLIDR